jgi:class 3 adenylate cyclase/tetratricopeptide (TPR) repeat protein
MQCPRCQHDNPGGARFCNRCGGELERVCLRCENPNPAGARFCNACGEQLEAAPSPPPERDPRSYTPNHLVEKILTSRSALEGERKQVTVLFADVKGSMDLAEQLDSEEWHRILNRFFEILTDGVHRFEGTVNQYTGDGIMALFGAPIAHEDHAQRACYAALHLRDELRHYADEVRRTHGLSFSVRTGLNSGEVVVGKIGDDLRMDYTAQGHVVGLGARMQELAEPGRVYLTAHTMNLVSGYFELRNLGSLRVKGLRDPMQAFELERVGRFRTRLDLSRARGFTRFVGRGHEMRTLETVLDQALEGRGQVVGVVGEAGVGKSRLCLEFVESCQARGVPVYEAHCPAHGKSIPFLPVLELFRSYFGITEQDGPAEARKKIAGTLVLLDEAFQETLPLVFDFLGVPDPERPAPHMDPDARQRQLFGFIRRLVEARSRREPAVMLLDDLHWIDAGSDAFIAQAVEAVTDTRTLLLTNFRPEYEAPWMDRSHYQQISLLPLGSEAIAELLDDLLGRDPSLTGLREQIQERTGGNPFFIEEMVQSLFEAEALQGGRGAYRLAEPIEELALPGTVQTVLAARIDRLHEREKQVLQTASVIGKEVSEPLLRLVAEMPDSELAAALEVLTRAEFLYERALYPEEEYAFKHPLTQEVAYGSQLAGRRRRIHGAVARAIEELHGEKLDEGAALLAHHWEEAGVWLDASRWHRRAAKWIGVSDTAESIRHWRRVRDLAGSEPDTAEARGLALEACFRILIFGWRVGLSEDEIAQVFAKGMELVGESGDAAARARLLDGYATAKGVATADWEEAIECIIPAIELADGTDDRGLQLALQQRLCFAQMMVGNYQAALGVADRALERSGEDVKLGAEVIGWSPYVLLLCLRSRILADTGRLEEAAVELNRAFQLARTADEPELLWWVSWYRALQSLAKGDLRAAMRHGREMVERAERLGNPWFRLVARVELARLLAENEDWRAALELSREIEQDPLNRANPQLNLGAVKAQAYLSLGEVTQARTVAQEGLAAAQSLTGNRSTEILIRLACASVLLGADGAGAREAVEGQLRQLSTLVDETGAVVYLPRIHEIRAELARILGDPAECERELREAHRLYVEMGATGHAERVAAELRRSGA